MKTSPPKLGLRLELQQTPRRRVTAKKKSPPAPEVELLPTHDFPTVPLPFPTVPLSCSLPELRPDSAQAIDEFSDSILRMIK